MAQTKSFDFAAGYGVIRRKVAKTDAGYTSMYFGRIALPEFGQCWIDGRVGDQAGKLTLDVKRAEDRKLIAKIELPRGTTPVREGTVKVLGKGGKTWTLRATMRENDEGEPRMVLRLPQVAAAYF